VLDPASEAGAPGAIGGTAPPIGSPLLAAGLAGAGVTAGVDKSIRALPGRKIGLSPVDLGAGRSSERPPEGGREGGAKAGQTIGTGGGSGVEEADAAALAGADAAVAPTVGLGKNAPPSPDPRAVPPEPAVGRLVEDFTGVAGSGSPTDFDGVGAAVGGATEAGGVAAGAFVATCLRSSATS